MYKRQAEQCVQLLTQGERCKVLTARVVAVTGDISDDDLKKIEDYLINPVESLSLIHILGVWINLFSVG